MTKLKSAIRNPQSAIVWLLFAVAILLVYFFGLTMPLVGPDEPRYAQVAREMFERRDWITPTLGGFNWFEKPALLYWLQIASYNIFGVSEFAARFGSALFGLGTVLSLWILGHRVEAMNKPTNEFANWLGLIGATTLGIIAFAHGASFDIILTFPITAAMVAYYIYDSAGVNDSTRLRLTSLIAFYFFIGVALLAKGLVGIVFPFAIVGLYHLLSLRLPSRMFGLSLFWGTLLSLAVASSWYLPMYLRHGHEFIDQFFIQHHFQRYTSNKYFHPQPFYFFLWVLPLMTLPWMPFFLASLINLGKQALNRQPTNTIGETDADDVAISRSPLLLFALAWLLVPLGFFSFSGSKLPGYVLPAVPAAVVLTADYIVRFIQHSVRRRQLVQAIAAATLVCVGITMVTLAPRFADADSVKGLFAVADDRGLGTLPVLMLHGVSHNAEFYAAGRIMRNSDGKQKALFGPLEVGREIRSLDGRPVLVLVPLEYLYQLTQADFLDVEVLKDNGEHALVLVVERKNR